MGPTGISLVKIGEVIIHSALGIKAEAKLNGLIDKVNLLEEINYQR